jgi:hypothetical protein
MTEIVKNCRITGKSFVVNDWEQELLRKFDVPPPTLCPEERHRRRLAHRNERKIYNDVCDLTGKAIISLYSPDKNLKVYSPEAWWGDKWDARDYGRDYDFTRPFFEQFAELQKDVPWLSLMNKNGENSDYCNITTDNKNCYLVFGGDFNEDCMHSLFNMHCRDVSDTYWVNKSELIYDSIDCLRCYNLRYCRNSRGCSDSAFLFECKNCKKCFGCVGLNSKEYHIFNKPYPPEEYEWQVKSYRLNTWSGVQRMKDEFKKFRLQFPHKFANIINCETSTGDILTEAKNCINCFSVEGPAEDLKDVFLAVSPVKNVASSDHIGHKVDFFYEIMGSCGGNYCAFCPYAWNSSNTFYCHIVDSCNNLFGCSNMRRAKYCILNKQYTKEEYEALLPRIIEHMKSTGEWGEFFPIENSLYAYNESVAQDFFPMTKDEILTKGWKWKDEEMREIGTGVEVPDSIFDIDDSICQKTLICEKTGRPYRIVATELKFYRKMEIPVPRYAPETRHEGRIFMRNPGQTWDRKCAKCSKEISTTYSPDRPEIVWCKECYLADFY